MSIFESLLIFLGLFCFKFHLVFIKCFKELRVNGSNQSLRGGEIFHNGRFKNDVHTTRLQNSICTVGTQMDDENRTGKFWFTKTKQVCTVGPSTFSAEMLEKLFLAGADIFRLNFSHGEHHEKQTIVERIRSLERKYDHPVAILADLQGPKIRIGKFNPKYNDKIKLVKGQKFILDNDPSLGNENRVELPHPYVLSLAKVNDEILLNDGLVKLRVTRRLDEFSIETEVIYSGFLGDRKGVNIPSMLVPISALSEKDKTDALFAQKLNVDYIALSFVQRKADLEELSELLGENSDVGLIAKIERPAAVDNIDEIIGAADGIMVARGDLGVEISPQTVPIVQKQLIEKCRAQGKPVIVATQMLESMTQNPFPTRAEASDVATAIYDGADAVMLSGETATGRYPEEAVRMQRCISEIVENDKSFHTKESHRRFFTHFSSAYDLYASKTNKNQKNTTNSICSQNYITHDVTDGITQAATTVADAVGAKVLVIFTVEGLTVRRAAMHRPDIPIMAITPYIAAARKLQLIWGVYPIVDSTLFDIKDCYIERMIDKACQLAWRKGFLTHESDHLILTTGLPFGEHGGTNVLHVCTGHHCSSRTANK